MPRRMASSACRAVRAVWPSATCDTWSSRSITCLVQRTKSPACRSASREHGVEGAAARPAVHGAARDRPRAGSSPGSVLRALEVVEPLPEALEAVPRRRGTGPSAASARSRAPPRGGARRRTRWRGRRRRARRGRSRRRGGGSRRAAGRARRRCGRACGRASSVTTRPSSITRGSRARAAPRSRGRRSGRPRRCACAIWPCSCSVSPLQPPPALRPARELLAVGATMCAGWAFIRRRRAVSSRCRRSRGFADWSPGRAPARSRSVISRRSAAYSVTSPRCRSRPASPSRSRRATPPAAAPCGRGRRRRGRPGTARTTTRGSSRVRSRPNCSIRLTAMLYVGRNDEFSG